LLDFKAPEKLLDLPQLQEPQSFASMFGFLKGKNG